MTFKDFYDSFVEQYNNRPLKFNDSFTGDGESKLFQMTELSISDYSPKLPVVKINGSTMIEGDDYEINYELGTILFTLAPPDGQEILIEAYHQKANLKEFINYYNRASIKVSIQFPLNKTEEINYTDVQGATENDVIKEIDLSQEPYSDWHDIKNILQYKNDYKGINYIHRDNYIMFTVGNKDNGDFGGLADYGYGFIKRESSSDYSSLKYPFYITGVKKYKKILTTGYTEGIHQALDEEIEIPDYAQDQMRIMVAILMYKGIYHKHENENSTSLRSGKLMELNRIISSLNYELNSNLRFEGYGKGKFEDHRIRFINTNYPDAY